MCRQLETSGWEFWHQTARDPRGVHFRVMLSSSDARGMSWRQRDDFFLGLALIAAAFEDDERFVDGSTPEERAESVRHDQRLADALEQWSRP